MGRHHDIPYFYVMSFRRFLLTEVMFAAAFTALFAAHQIADHWIQTQHQAITKGEPGWRGRRACAGHVATYTLAQGAALAAVCAVTGERPRPTRVAAALALSAATHYLADRRTPLRRMAEATGHGDFFALGAPRAGRDDNPSLGTGAYAMDQSWHIGWIGVASLLLGSRQPGR